jgi:hypothetical protein
MIPLFWGMLTSLVVLGKTDRLLHVDEEEFSVREDYRRLVRLSPNTLHASLRGKAKTASCYSQSLSTKMSPDNGSTTRFGLDKDTILLHLFCRVLSSQYRVDQRLSLCYRLPVAALSRSLVPPSSLLMRRSLPIDRSGSSQWNCFRGSVQHFSCR